MSGEQDQLEMQMQLPQPRNTQQTGDAPGAASSEDDALTPPPPPKHTAVLQKLPAPPFPRSKFPLVGILASVYEHVTQVASRQWQGGGAPQADSSESDRAA